MNPIFLLLAFVAGAALATQAAVNSGLAGGLHGAPLAAALISFAVGTLALGVIAAMTGSLGAVGHVAGQPLWRAAGGLLGAGAIYCTVLLAPRIGLAALLALMIAGQLVASLCIDHFGLVGAAVRPATPARLLGAGLMLAGVTVALFGERVSRLLVAH